LASGTAARCAHEPCERSFLGDSSGHADGRQNSQCASGSVDLTHSSSTFGAYEAAGRANSDAIDTVHLFATAQLTEYQTGPYVPDPILGGITLAALASADYTGIITIHGPGVPAVLHGWRCPTRPAWARS
jgi:hypothetical protein